MSRFKISSLPFWLVSIYCLFGTLQSYAQMDSLSLKMNTLGKEDVLVNEREIGSQKVISASRSLKTLDELPFTIYVVTQEEIFENGYTTLVDILKSVPGIRVSQPGSAQDGETFLMRGLLGNSYTKVLINGLPVKPSVLGSMPIGAQLPIRQAERIEIIFGPAAAIYGADASAGVINIILKETERPVFTRADLSVGENGYKDLNIMFGGKIGRDKNILRFSVYGSSTVFDDRETVYQESTLYNTLNYAEQPDIRDPSSFRLDTSYISNPNYRGTLTRPRFGDLPHLSRMFGFNLRYKIFKLSYMNMYRRDYSTIGLNPYAVAYFNPLNYVGETINRFNFGVEKDYRYFGFNFNLTGIIYEMDNRSSFTYVHNSLWRFFDVSVLQPEMNPVIRDSLRNEIFDKFFSGQRFSASKSFDVNAELIFNVHPIKEVELVFGANLQASANDPMINYLQRPLELDFLENSDSSDFSEDIPINPPDTVYAFVGAFAQLYLDLNWVNIVGGVRYDYHTIYGESTNPRGAIIFTPVKWLSLRSAYATAFRVPTPFYTANTYSIKPGDINSISTGTQDLNPEKTESLEIGARITLGKIFYADLSFYRTETKNFISYNFNPNLVPDINSDRVQLGYFNDANSRVEVEGLQARVVFRNLFPRIKFNTEINLNIAQGSEVLPFDRGTLNVVRMQPQTMGQVNVSFKPGRKLYLNFKNIFMSEWLSRNAFSPDITDDKIAGFYTLDFMARIEITDNFQAYLKINNLFNREYGGIGATGFVDDLFFNPQPNTFVLLGLSYTMD